MSVLNWVVAKHDSDCDNIAMEFVMGTQKQVAEYLLEQLKSHKKQEEENGEEWDAEPISMDNIIYYASGELYACAIFADKHIDFTAKPWDNIEKRILGD